VRKAGALGLILSHCNISDDNPYIKEWSLLAIRNLLEDNIENQSFIESLKAERVASVAPMLSSVGLTATLDKDSGKVKINRQNQ